MHAFRIPALFTMAAFALALMLTMSVGVAAQEPSDEAAPAGESADEPADESSEGEASGEDGEAKTEGDTETKADAEADAEEALPDFENYEAIVEHFEPLRAEIQEEYEKKSRISRLKPSDIEKLNQRLKAVDQRFVQALTAYIEQAKGWDPQPADLVPARRELVMFSSRFGEWQAVIDHADTFLKEHSDADADSTREVHWLRADALFRLVDRNDDAVTALESVIEDYPESFEAGLARDTLYRLQLFRDRVDSARRMVLEILDRPEVVDDPRAQDHYLRVLDNLDMVGEDLPEFDFETPEGDDHERANLLGKPFVLWYWDSTVGVCLDELDAIKAVADAWKDDLRVYTISVNDSKEAWKDFIDEEDGDDNLLHRFEGNVEGEGDERLSSTKLGFGVIPMIILVEGDGDIHRFDVPAPELERSIRAWIGEPSTKDDDAGDADTEAEGSSNDEE